MSEHKNKGSEHGTLPSVKGPGYTAHDPGELCDTYDADGNGDDLCPPPTCEQGQHLTQADGHHAQTCVADPPKPEQPPIAEVVPPAVVVAQPVTTTTTVAQPHITTALVTSEPSPSLPNTGAMTVPVAGLGLTLVFIGAALVRWGKALTKASH